MRGKYNSSGTPLNSIGPWIIISLLSEFISSKDIESTTIFRFDFFVPGFKFGKYK